MIGRWRREGIRSQDAALKAMVERACDPSDVLSLALPNLYYTI
jgi:hypothetical protein